MTSAASSVENVHNELLLLYQTSVGDLAFFKQQQWSCANYCLLLLAAIVAAIGLLGRTPKGWEVSVAVLLVATVAVVAVVVILKHERAIKIRRDRLNELRDSFSQEFKRAWGVQAKPDEVVSVLAVLTSAVFVAGIVAAWLLIARYL
jgi:Ca2+/Na+ antiporter